MADTYDGLVNGQVELTATHIIIHRKGVLSFLTQGLKGEKRIPYASITSVQFKPGSLMTNGYIQFGVAGGKESKGGLFAATSDENTVMFKKSANEPFAHLRELVESRAEDARRGPAAVVAPTSVATELMQLAELQQRGLLTDEEFRQQKAKLLG